MEWIHINSQYWFYRHYKIQLTSLNLDHTCHTETKSQTNHKATTCKFQSLSVSVSQDINNNYNVPIQFLHTFFENYIFQILTFR